MNFLSFLFCCLKMMFKSLMNHDEMFLLTLLALFWFLVHRLLTSVIIDYKLIFKLRYGNHNYDRLETPF